MEQAIMYTLDDKGKEKQKINVQFNPSDYSTSRSVKTSGGNGVVVNGKPLQFIAEENETVKVKLTLDGFTKAGVLDPEKASDILEDTKFFTSLAAIDASLHMPPACVFSWGSFTFTGYVEQLAINYSMFASNGKPIRATVDLSLRNALDKKVAYQSPDRTKRMVLTQDTPLYMTAYEAYIDPAEWRRIAVANGIKNPRKLHLGLVLKVPPMEPDKV